MKSSSERARASERQRKYRLCSQIIREARRCVELAGNPIRIQLADPYADKTKYRRRHRIRA